MMSVVTTVMKPNVLTKAKLFRGLGDPSRLSVIESLRDGPKCVSDIVAMTGLSQPGVSTHLACLRDCGLVERQAQGRFAFYRIASDEVRAILESAETVLMDVCQLVDDCENYQS